MHRTTAVTAICATASLFIAAPWPAAAQSTTAPAAAPAEEIAEVTIVGIRESVQKAQQIKRDAAVNVEAITTQDLGKFLDSSVSDAIQRVPGIQLQRNDDSQSGDRIAIRGLGSQYVTTTVNGREALSYGDYGGNLRSYNLDSVPSEILTGVTVYKSSSAEMIEPGLAGAVELHLLRPLDYKPEASNPYFGSISLRDDYDDRAKKYSPRVSGFAGGKFRGGTLGAYLAFTATDLKRRQDEIEPWNVSRDIRYVDTVGGPIKTATGVAVPDEWNLRVTELERKRRTLTTGVQFKPDDQWDINADFTYNKYDIEGTTDTVRIIPGEPGVYAGIFQPGGITLNGLGSGFSYISQLDSTKVLYDDPNPNVYQLASPNVLLGNELQSNRSKSYSGGINVAWHNDLWKINGDFARSTVHAYSEFREFYTYSPVVPIQFDGRNASHPVYSVGGSFQDQSQYRCIYSAGFPTPDPTDDSPACYFLNHIQFKGFRNATRLDFERKLTDSTKLKFGARYQDTTIDNRNGQDFSEVPASAFTALRGGYFTGRTRDTYPGVGLGAVPLVDSAAGCAASPELSAICGKTNFDIGSFAGGFPRVPSNPADQIDYVAWPSFHQIRERELNLYAQADTRGKLGSVPYDANFGVRGVKIEEDAQGFVGETQVDNLVNGNFQNGQYTYIASDNSYWQVLPSLNLTLHPRNNVNVRFAAAKVMSLPQMEDMSVSGNILYGIDAQGLPGGAGTGNIKLKPITSWNYDLTGEYYTDYGGAYVASLFYKDAKNFILPSTQNGVQIPGFTPTFPTNTTSYNVSQPVNFSDGHAYGYELGTNQPFTFLPDPWNGFGVQLNYTYVYSKFDRPDPRATYGFPGSSKHNVNSIFYFERHGFGARVAYSYRSDYFNAFGDGNGYRTAFPSFSKAQEQVDASLSYVISRHFEVSLSGQNLTRQGRYDYSIDPGFMRASWTRPAVYSLGVRASL